MYPRLLSVVKNIKQNLGTKTKTKTQWGSKFRPFLICWLVAFFFWERIAAFFHIWP